LSKARRRCIAIRSGESSSYSHCGLWDEAIALDVSIVRSVAIWFEVVNHKDVELVLVRIVLELRLGQPKRVGVLAPRHPVPRDEEANMTMPMGARVC
jgi:hypothetical protein